MGQFGRGSVKKVPHTQLPGNIPGSDIKRPVD